MRLATKVLDTVKTFIAGSAAMIRTCGRSH